MTLRRKLTVKLKRRDMCLILKNHVLILRGTTEEVMWASITS